MKPVQQQQQPVRKTSMSSEGVELNRIGHILDSIGIPAEDPTNGVPLFMFERVGSLVDGAKTLENTANVQSIFINHVRTKYAISNEDFDEIVKLANEQHQANVNRVNSGSDSADLPEPTKDPITQ